MTTHVRKQRNAKDTVVSQSIGHTGYPGYGDDQRFNVHRVITSNYIYMEFRQCTLSWSFMFKVVKKCGWVTGTELVS